MKLTTTCLFVALAATLLGCSEEVAFQYSNLDGPTGITTVRGDVCLTTSIRGGVVNVSSSACAPNQKGTIGLVTNANSDSLIVMDLLPSGTSRDPNANNQPRFVDTDLGTPGITHLPVGRRPVAVAGAPDGRTAYTLNQIGRSISVVDLLNLSTLPDTIPLKTAPIAFDITIDGQIVTVGAGSHTLELHQVATCTGAEANTCAVNKGLVASVALPGQPTDLAVVRPSDAKERFATSLPNAHNLAYISYRDLQVVSVVALDDAALTASKKPCLDGAAHAPCLITHIPLSYGCNDGIDNDGDGLIDAKDPQCMTPYGSEAGWNDPIVLAKVGQSGDFTNTPNESHSDVIGGPSRVVRNTCNDGIDNNSDGRIDAEDPNCIASGGASELAAPKSVVVTACNDGIDNDGDGKTDAADEACYTPGSPQELSPAVTGFDQLSIDPTGSLLWVLDRAGSQVLLVDAVRHRLIDIPKGAEPPLTPFVHGLGASIPRNVVSLHAQTDQRVILESENNTSAGYGVTTFSALVGTDLGFVYKVEAFQLVCKTLSPNDCVTVPLFPVHQAANLKACGGTLESATCSCASDESSCQCNQLGDAGAKTYLDSHTTCNTTSKQIWVNPLFGVADLGSRAAGVGSLGLCSVPEKMVADAVAFSQKNRVQTVNPGSCDSLIIPQPKSVSAPLAKYADGTRPKPTEVDIASHPRADIPQATLINTFSGGGSEVGIVSRPWTSRVSPEKLVVAYQGELLRSRRVDWVLPESLSKKDINGQMKDVGTFLVGTDLCQADVKPGDLLELLSVTKSRESVCDPYRGDASKRRFEVVEVRPGSVQVVALEDGAPIPLRDGPCFPTTVLAVVHAKGDWVLLRRGSAGWSSQMAQNGRCVPSLIPTTSSDRVAPGAVYQGLGLSFRMYEGFIPPREGLEYTIDVTSTYAPDRYRPSEAGGNYTQAGTLPYRVYQRDFLGDDVALFLVTDPTANLIWYRVTRPISGSGFSTERKTQGYLVQ